MPDSNVMWRDIVKVYEVIRAFGRVMREYINFLIIFVLSETLLMMDRKLLTFN